MFPVNNDLATTGHKLQGMTKKFLIVSFGFCCRPAYTWNIWNWIWYYHVVWISKYFDWLVYNLPYCPILVENWGVKLHCILEEFVIQM